MKCTTTYFIGVSCIFFGMTVFAASYGPASKFESSKGKHYTLFIKKYSSKNSKFLSTYTICETSEPDSTVCKEDGAFYQRTLKKADVKSAIEQYCYSSDVREVMITLGILGAEFIIAWEWAIIKQLSALAGAVILDFSISTLLRTEDIDAACELRDGKIVNFELQYLHDPRVNLKALQGQLERFKTDEQIDAETREIVNGYLMNRTGGVVPPGLF